MKAPPQLVFYNKNHINMMPQLNVLSVKTRDEIRAAAEVFPFRMNNYVLENLINWENVPNDPVFRLTFPMREMLYDHEFEKLDHAINSGKSREQVKRIVSEIRNRLNPHPAEQLTMNVPYLEGQKVEGLQHKYKETCLIFPSEGQTCQSYCTFCFRWAQFTGDVNLKFAVREMKRFLNYIRNHKEITNVLITGGDPMVMKADRIAKYITPLLEPEFDHVKVIRIGTKSLTYWPARFVSDPDSEDLLNLFSEVARHGKHLSVMAHFNHYQEMETGLLSKAIHNIRKTGASVRTQSPLLRHINDNAVIWEKMWKMQVSLGCIPYYMFVERDTGAHEYFAVPLAKAVNIFREAFTRVSGLARTVRGPSMSATPGKILIEGVTTIAGEKVFILNMIQARKPEWAKKTFFARYDENATWINQLTPAFGEDQFFYENELTLMKNMPYNHFLAPSFSQAGVQVS